MIFYDLHKLETESRDTKEFLHLFKIHCTSKLFVKRHSGLNLTGSSFILKPTPLLYPPKSFDKEYIVQYIKLAGRRDYLLYKQYGVKHLILSYYPDINLDSIKHNTLLKIRNNNLYFKFEEIV